MDENNHRIFFARFDFCRRQKPALNVEPSFVHSRFSALPHVADNAELLFVSCRHSPMGPAQTSGGVSKVLRSTAADLPSLERAKSGKLPKA